MATGLPTQTQVIELLAGEFERAGYEIEDVVIDTRSRTPRITVIADGDTPLDLETVSALSRSASALLDGLDDIRTGYLLEVSSPGVERPLTSEKHFRRARGRKVQLELADGSQLTGRVGQTFDNAITLVVRDSGDREPGAAGRSGSPPSEHSGDREPGAAGRSGSPPSEHSGDREPGRAGRSGAPPSGQSGEWTVREIPLSAIVKAVVQVEFSPPSQLELELATLGRAVGTEAGA